MDLKREIKLSHLFKRRPKDAPAGAPEVPGARPVEEPARERGGLFFRRKAWRPAEDLDSPNPSEPRKERGRRRDKSAEPAPQVPLMRAFDLLPKDGVRHTAERRRASTAQLALAVAALVLLAGLASFFLITSATIADKERERDVLQAELAAENVPAEKPEPIGPDQELLEERDRRTAALSTALGSRIAWDRLLREFSLVLPDDVWLKTITATAGTSGEAPPDPNAVPTATTFQVSGYTREQEGVARLLARMAVLPELESAKLISSTTVMLGTEEVVEFAIDAVVKRVTAEGSA